MWQISSWLLDLITKNSYLNNYSEKLFCEAYCFNFQSNQGTFFVKHIKFEKRKALRKELNEGLMSTVWHPRT